MVYSTLIIHNGDVYKRQFFHFADYRTDEVNKLKGEPSAKKIAIVHSESYRTSFSYSGLSHTYAMQMYNSS